MISKARIAGTGVATLDLYLNKGRMYPGGNEYNVVCHARRVGAEAGFLGAWGYDRAGDILESTLKDLGVDTSLCRELEGSSGYCLVRIDEDGERVFLGWNEQGVTDLNPVEFNEAELDFARSYDVLCAGLYSDLSVDKMKYLHEQGVDICYDFNSSFQASDIEAVAPWARYGFFSCSHLSDEEIRQLLADAFAAGLEIGVATRGIDPVVVYDGQEYIVKETLKVKATDTLGAGDSFIAAFMSWYIESVKSGLQKKAAIEAALTHATEYSAGVVQIEGSLGFGYDIDVDNLSQLVDLADSSMDMKLR